MPSIPYTVVDAFTTLPFKGNPAAVIVLHTPLPDVTLQNIAAEFNLSETVFITPVDAPNGEFGLRWFTPQKEVALCGHATLASAHVLFSNRDVLPKSVQLIQFQTNVSGILTAKLLEDRRIELEFPAGEPVSASKERNAFLRDAILKAFADSSNLVINAIAVGGESPYQDYVIIEVNEDFRLENAKVKDMDAIVAMAPKSRVIIVTQKSNTGQESFRSRVFAPAVGVSEDPVCGSAHSLLGPYWEAKLGKTSMLGRHVSSRSGELGIELDGERKIVKLQGHAVTVAKGELFLSI